MQLEYCNVSGILNAGSIGRKTHPVSFISYVNVKSGGVSFEELNCWVREVRTVCKSWLS